MNKEKLVCEISDIFVYYIRFHSVDGEMSNDKLLELSTELVYDFLKIASYIIISDHDITNEEIDKFNDLFSNVIKSSTIDDAIDFCKYSYEKFKYSSIPLDSYYTFAMNESLGVLAEEPENSILKKLRELYLEIASYMIKVDGVITDKEKKAMYNVLKKCYEINSKVYYGFKIPQKAAIIEEVNKFI